MTARKLSSNGVRLPDNRHYVGSLTSSSLDDLGSGVAGRRYEDDGYVFLRGALPRDAVLDLRQAYLAMFPREFVRDGDCRRGEFSGRLPRELPDHGLAGHPAYEFVRGDTFNAFADQPVLASIAETLLGGPAERIRRTPLRHFFRGRKAASRAHIDGAYIAGGTDDVVTLWIPLGDCPAEAGGLVYLDRSHRDIPVDEIAALDAPTNRPDDKRPITHDLKWMSEVTDRRWLIADYRAGDVVAHTPSIVHASLDTSTDLMRVSTDIRFIRAGSAHDPRWQEYWSADDGY
ncbi:MAG: phytanoyl-CoA dioxygenase family protein [Arenicellales bacterium]|jgi:ectoine hydroxylase-related dioxygenase (phytanoyl-CoA dioxygenase family)